jgi:hypothetical protein
MGKFRIELGSLEQDAANMSEWSTHPPNLADTYKIYACIAISERLEWIAEVLEKLDKPSSPVQGEGENSAKTQYPESVTIFDGMHNPERVIGFNSDPYYGMYFHDYRSNQSIKFPCIEEIQLIHDLTGQWLAARRGVVVQGEQEWPDYKIIEKLFEIIHWMSGSPSFSPGGEAYVGWCKAKEDLDKIIPVWREREDK